MMDQDKSWPDLRDAMLTLKNPPMPDKEPVPADALAHTGSVYRIGRALLC
jgi:hypothetical protein